MYSCHLNDIIASYNYVFLLRNCEHTMQISNCLILLNNVSISCDYIILSCNYIISWNRVML